MKKNLLFLMILPAFLFSQQECFLCIGGRDDEIIKAVFELNEDQVENLRNWGAELKFRNEIFELRAENLLQNHPQSSPEDLLKMSFKYKALLDSMQANVRLLDKRMLGIFNKDQYNLYIMLCNSIYRSPLYADRSVNEKR